VPAVVIVVVVVAGLTVRVRGKLLKLEKLATIEWADTDVNEGLAVELRVIVAEQVVCGNVAVHSGTTVS